MNDNLYILDTSLERWGEETVEKNDIVRVAAKMDTHPLGLTHPLLLSDIY